MGLQTAVPYHRTPLFRQLSKFPEQRPRTDEGNPQHVLTAWCMMVTGIDRLRPDFVRQPEKWNAPQTGDIREIIHDFVRHLFVRYPVPAFMYKAWESDNDFHKKWFIHLGAGKNLRKAEDLPFHLPMTKMHAHYFCQAPSWMTIQQALRYGQVLSMDGSVYLAKIIATSRLGQVIDPANEPFWVAALREIIQAEDLTARQIRAVIDHWYELFFVPQFSVTAQGRKKPIVPSDRLNPLNRACLADILERLLPNPSLIGLSADALEKYETPFPKMNEGWKRKVAGVRVLNNYEIRQLRTSAQLYHEGQKMSHCVATYAWRCRRGHTFIFSFRNTQQPFHQTCLTIEVSRYMRIIQVKGPSNRLPTPEEKKAVLAWAKLANVNPDCWDMRE